MLKHSVHLLKKRSLNYFSIQIQKTQIKYEHQKYLNFNNEGYAVVFWDKKTTERIKMVSRLLFVSASINTFMFLSEVNRKSTE